MKFFAVALAALFITGGVIRADSGSPVYDISGTMTFTGVSGQVETVNFDFDVDFAPCGSGCFGRGPYTPTIVGTPIVTSAGAMGAFTMGTGWVDYENFFEFSDAEGDEVDLRFSPTFVSEVLPTGASGEIYRCGGIICADQFDTLQPGFPYYGGGVNYAVTTLTATNVTPAPEPSALMMLALGLASVLVVSSARRGHAS